MHFNRLRFGKEFSDEKWVLAHWLGVGGLLAASELFFTREKHVDWPMET